MSQENRQYLPPMDLKVLEAEAHTRMLLGVQTGAGYEGETLVCISRLQFPDHNIYIRSFYNDPGNIQVLHEGTDEITAYTYTGARVRYDDKRIIINGKTQGEVGLLTQELTIHKDDGTIRITEN